MNTADRLITSLLNEISLSRLGRRSAPAPVSRPAAGKPKPNPANQNRTVDDSDDGEVIVTKIASERPQPTYKPPKVSADRFRSPKVRMSQPIMTTRRHFGKRHGTNLWRQRT